jgi:hypothetical protein
VEFPVLLRYRAGCHMELVALGAFLGGLVALVRSRVVLVVSASVFVGLIVTAHGLMGHSVRVSVITGFAALFAVQSAYMALSFLLEQPDIESPIIASRAAIAERLRFEIEVPRDLPPQLIQLVERLQTA